MKNIVFIINIGNKPEYQYSIQAWKHWCDKNDCQLLLMGEPIADPKEMHVIWQRYYLFDLLEHNGIDYNQILLVDADTLIHPNCPDFFKLTDNKYTLVHDQGSYDWILRGMEHYRKHIFKQKWFDFWDYGNSGFQIVNNDHRLFFDNMRQFYFDNKETIQHIQNKFGIGTDQTPLNFMLRKHKIDLKWLPFEFNMTCMLKREILGNDHLYTKLGWIYHFNGIPEKEKNVPILMEKAYKHLYKK